jgi:hypothetical protein
MLRSLASSCYGKHYTHDREHTERQISRIVGQRTLEVISRYIGNIASNRLSIKYISREYRNTSTSPRKRLR